MDMAKSHCQRGPNAGQIAVGLIVVAMGVMLLVDRHFGADTRLIRSWWPFVLISWGPYGWRPPGRSCGVRPRRSGAWLIIIGLWGLVSESHLFGLTYATTWPLLVIGAGVMIVWRSDGRPGPVRAPGAVRPWSRSIPPDRPAGGGLTSAAADGLLIIAVGVLFTLDNLGLAHAVDYLRYWPAGLIAVGLLKLWDSRDGTAAPSAGS